MEEPYVDIRLFISVNEVYIKMYGQLIELFLL